MNRKNLNFILCMSLVASAAFWGNDNIYAAEMSGTDYEITADETLPSSVDLRKSGLVTEIKNQGELGTCWAHAALGSIESMVVPDIADIDLSEMFLAAMSVQEYGGDINNGESNGNVFALLTNWMGPVSEETAPYGIPYTTSMTRAEIQAESLYHVTNARSLYEHNDADYEKNMYLAKKALNEGHALYFTMSSFDQSYGLNYETNAFYSAGEMSGAGGHAMLIVGYDDNFSASNFLTPPERDGAWLVKNSWDTSFGDNGYFWVSYCEPLQERIIYFEAEYADEHDYIYEYDDYGTSGTFAFDSEGDETVWSANVFRAEQNCFITDVMLRSAAENDNVEITICTDLQDMSDPLSGTAGKTTYSVLDTNGYKTIKLDEPAFVQEGTPYSVVVKYSGEKGSHIPCEYNPVYCEDNEAEQSDYYLKSDMNLSFGTDENSEMILSTFDRQQSFCSKDGTEWIDMYDINESVPFCTAGNISVKAMAVKESKVLFSDYSNTVKKGDSVSLSSPDGRNIYCSVNGGDYQIYTEPLTVDEDIMISAYTEGHEDEIYSHSYSVRKAELSSLLLDYPDKYYLDFTDDNQVNVTVKYRNDSVSIIPVTTGQVIVDGVTYNSYDTISLAAPQGTETLNYTMTVCGDGLEDTVYNIALKNGTAECLSGTYVSDYDNRVYKFMMSEDNDYIGTFQNVINGDTCDFSYSIEDDTITMISDDETRKGKIASGETIAYIEWEDGVTEELYIYSFDIIDKIYTADVIKQMASAHFAAQYKKAPDTIETEVTDLFYLSVKMDEDTVYNVDFFRGVGFDQDGSVIDLNLSPEYIESYTFQAGTWVERSENSNNEYYYFDESGEYVYIYNMEEKYSDRYRYTVSGRTMNIYDEDDNIIYSWHIVITENGAEISNGQRYSSYLERYSDKSPEEIGFYSVSELTELIRDYYLNNYLLSVDVTCLGFSGPDKLSFNILCEDPEESFLLLSDVDIITGEEVGDNDEKIDYKYRVFQETAEFKGIWKITRDGKYQGFISFSDDSPSGVYKDIFGTETVVSYRTSGERAVFTIGETKEILTVVFDTDYFMQTSDGVIMRWTFAGEGNFEDFSFYSVDELREMALVDYEKRTGEKDCITDFETDTDCVVIAVINPDAETNNVRKVLNVVPESGLAYCGDNGSVEFFNLPQTGITSPASFMSYISAAISVALGSLLMFLSGKRKIRK